MLRVDMGVVTAEGRYLFEAHEQVETQEEEKQGVKIKIVHGPRFSSGRSHKGLTGIGCC